MTSLRCLVRGHEDVRVFDGPRSFCRCLHCGIETVGWVAGEPTADVFGTQTYWDTAYAEIMDAELALHGGG